MTEAGEMGRQQQTVCDKQSTTVLAACGAVRALAHGLEKRTFDEVIARSNCQTRQKIMKKNEHCSLMPQECCEGNTATVAPLVQAHHILDI